MRQSCLPPPGGAICKGCDSATLRRTLCKCFLGTSKTMTVKHCGTLRYTNYVRTLFFFRYTIFVRSRDGACVRWTMDDGRCKKFRADGAILAERKRSGIFKQRGILVRRVCWYVGRPDASVPHYLSALRAKAALLSNPPPSPRGLSRLCFHRP